MAVGIAGVGFVSSISRNHVILERGPVRVSFREEVTHFLER